MGALGMVKLPLDPATRGALGMVKLPLDPAAKGKVGPIGPLGLTGPEKPSRGVLSLSPTTACAWLSEVGTSALAGGPGVMGCAACDATN